ncbi:metalloendopeptidase [Aureococcus anophagefferens]|nr:metalloendopeptidase [Aureococcus anophagefferens]
MGDACHHRRLSALRAALVVVFLATADALAGFGAKAVKKKKKKPALRTDLRKAGTVLPLTHRPVPEGIMRPDYAADGTPKKVDLRPSWMIEVKSAKDVEMMRAGKAAREVLDAAGAAVKPGVTTDAIDAVAHAAAVARGAYPSPLNYHGFPRAAARVSGGIIEDAIKGTGYKSVEQFCGHGIGKLFHTNPNILHYRNKDPNGIMAVGHTFTIEPMICEGTINANLWKDNWTAVTKDGGRSAQFEHTLLITEDGIEALTGKLDDSPLQPWEETRGGFKTKWAK